MQNVSPLDPRVNAMRPDLADARLGALVEAARYAEPQMKQSLCGRLPLWAAPCEGARRVSDLRYGEFLDVIEERDDGFAWVQCRADQVVGYIKSGDYFCESIASLENRVVELQTYLYAAPDRRAPVRDVLPLGAYVSPLAAQGDFLELEGGGFVFAAHIAPSQEVEFSDYVSAAGRLLNVPYLSGGRTSLGIDPGGLVQLALDLVGIEAPRFADLQREAYGKPLSTHWQDKIWKRGELVFFDGPVGIMTGATHVLHASARAMKVVCEPLVDVVQAKARIVSAGRPL